MSAVDLADKVIDAYGAMREQARENVAGWPPLTGEQISLLRTIFADPAPELRLNNPHKANAARGCGRRSRGRLEA